MAVASTGLSIGGIAVAPVIALALQDFSLRTVTTVAAVVFLVLCLLATTAVVPDPGLRGLAPDGQPAAVTTVEPAGATRAQALRSTGFWGISAAQTLAALAQVGGLTHLYALVASREPASVAGAALSCVALGSLSGRLLGGWVLQRTSTATFFRLLLVVQAGALVVLSVGEGTWLLLIASALFGLTIGNVLLVHPLLLAEVFGLRDFARVLSASGFVATAGIACGPLVVGLLRATTGSWTSGYLAAAGASLTGAALLHLTVRGRRNASAPVADEPRVAAAGTALGVTGQ